jgi:hypothetical protein
MKRYDVGMRDIGVHRGPGFQVKWRAWLRLGQAELKPSFGRTASAEIQPCPASHADDTEADDLVEQSTQKNPLYQVNHSKTNRPSQTINSGSGQTLLLNRHAPNNTG